MNIKKNKINKLCTNCFEPIFLKFNFSYVVYDEEFDDVHKIKFMDRIMELSSSPYNVIMNRGKKISFELIDIGELNIKKEIPEAFKQDLIVKDIIISGL